MNSNPVSVVLVGIGGYGGNYVRWMADLEAAGLARVAGVVDPMAEAAAAWHELAARGVPRFDTVEAFLHAAGGVGRPAAPAPTAGARRGIAADLAVIASPIAFHADQSCALLGAGISVLCEKPIAATVADARRMADSSAVGPFLEVGYQWSYSKAIQLLKADILAGRLGAPRGLSPWVAWPRSSSYYRRNSWAGAVTDPDGRLVLDSPVNKATAHYLHNMLYVLGPTVDGSARPKTVTGECYRANPIQNYDAACCRIETDLGAEILFFTAHCVKEKADPEFRFEFDDAVVEYRAGGEVVARLPDGQTKSYGDPFVDDSRKLRHCVARTASAATRKAGRDPQVAGASGAVRRGESSGGPHERPYEASPASGSDLFGSGPICPAPAAAAHTICVAGMQEIPVRVFDPAEVATETLGPPAGDGAPDILTYRPGLTEAMRRGFQSGRLFSEMGEAWASPATTVDLGPTGVKR